MGLVGRALVELHDDVAVQHGLDLHADLGCEKQLVAVDRTGELHPFLADLAHLAQRPDLKAPRIRQDWLVPVFEGVQAAELLHHVQPRPHPQMEGVAQDDLRAHLVQAARHHALDRAVGAHGHEDGRLDHAVVQRQAPAPGVRRRIGRQEVEAEHGRQAAGLWATMRKPGSGLLYSMRRAGRCSTRTSSKPASRHRRSTCEALWA